MNQAVKIVTTPQPLCETLDNESYGSDELVDSQQLRLDRAREALRGLSALIGSEHATNECLMGRRGDLASLIEIIREELEAGLTGRRIHQ